MRKIVLACATLIALSLRLHAQSYTYSVLENDPNKAYSKFVAPEWGLEAGGDNYSIVVGANARMGISDRLAFEGDAQVDVLQANGTGLGFHLEGGIFLPLKTKTVIKDVPVILSYNPYAGSKFENGQQYHIEETKYITIPDMDYKDQYGLRAGIYTRNTGVESDGIKAPAASGSAFLAGPYLGFQKTSQAYVKTKINDDVERFGAGFARYFVDILVFPVKSLTDEAIAPGLKKDKTIGWRVGYQWYLDPHEGKFKRLLNSVFTGEIGSRPYTGLYLNMTWGLAFLNQR